MVMGMANLAMATGNIGRSGVGVNPLRGQNNVQGSCDMGSFPHELPGYRHISGDDVRSEFERHWGVTLDPEPGFRIPNMFDAACAGEFKGMYIQGEDLAQSDPNTHHVEAALSNMECIVVQDLFLNETAKVRARLPARHVVPRERRDLYKRGAAHQSRTTRDAGAAGQGRVADYAGTGKCHGL